MTRERERAGDELLDATSRGWYVGQPSTEVEAVREMARCLREIVEGRVPK